MLTAPALTFVFLCVVVALGAAFVWMFWEFEQVFKPLDHDRVGKRLSEWRGPH